MCSHSVSQIFFKNERSQLELQAWRGVIKWGANGYGLLLCWYLLMSSRQLKAIKITNAEDNNKC